MRLWLLVICVLASAIFGEVQQCGEQWWACDVVDQHVVEQWVPPDEKATDIISHIAINTRSNCEEEGSLGKALSPVLPVTAAIARSRSNDSHVVFVMRAGENEGRFVQYVPGCHLTFARGSSLALGASAFDVKRPLRLYSTGGRGLARDSDARASSFDGLLHVYLEGNSSRCE